MINDECASDLRALDNDYNVLDNGYEPIFGVGKLQKQAKYEYDQAKRKPFSETSAVYKTARTNTIAHYQRELLRVEKINNEKILLLRRKGKTSAADNVEKFIKQCYLDINTRCKLHLEELADKSKVQYVEYQQIFGNLQTDIEKDAQAAKAAKAKEGSSMLSDSEDEGQASDADDAAIAENERPAGKSCRGRKPTPHPNADKVKKRGGAFNARKELIDGKAKIRPDGTLDRKAKRSKMHVSAARNRRIKALDAEEERLREEEQKAEQQDSASSTAVAQDDGDLSRFAERQKTPSSSAILGDDDIQLPLRDSWNKRSREPSPKPATERKSKRKRLHAEAPAYHLAVTEEMDLANKKFFER